MYQQLPGKNGGWNNDKSASLSVVSLERRRKKKLFFFKYWIWQSALNCSSLSLTNRCYSVPIVWNQISLKEEYNILSAKQEEFEDTKGVIRLYIDEEQATQWPEEKGQTTLQLSSGI